MRCGDPFWELDWDGDHEICVAAVFAVNAVIERLAPEHIGAGEPASRQIPPEALQCCRAALKAALDSFDAAMKRNPSGPRRLEAGDA